MKLRSKILFLLPTILPIITISCANIDSNLKSISDVEKSLTDLKNKFDSPQNNSSENINNLLTKINEEIQNLKKILNSDKLGKFNQESEKILSKLSTFSDDDLQNQDKKAEFQKTFSELVSLVQNQKDTPNPQNPSPSPAPGPNPNPIPDPNPGTSPNPGPIPNPNQPRPEPVSPEKTASLAPQGQTFSRWSNNKRIVEDQYQYDDPKKELEYHRSLNNIPSQSGFTRASVLKPFPESFNLPNSSVLEKLNQQAKEANQPYYQNAQLRGFSLPEIGSDGEIKGILINNFVQPPAVPAYWGNEKLTGGSNRNGLPRVLPNDTYRKIAKNSFSFGIRNGRQRDPNDNIENPDAVKRVIRSDMSFGTAAILDFEKTENGSYPLKWFFITNAHVAASLRLANDTPSDKSQVWGRDESNYSEAFRQYNTWTITLTKLKNTTPIHSKLPTSIGEGFATYYDSEEVRVKELDGTLYNNGRDGQYERNSLLVNKTPEKPLNVRTIVIGTNALKSSPKDFSSQKVYQNIEEVLDFAVVEVNFDNEAQAKKMTQDYFEAAQQQNHYQGREENFLDPKIYEKIPPTDFYGFGWPSTQNESQRTLDRYENPTDFANRRFQVSPWFNKPEALYFNNNPEDKRWENGGEFAWSRSYRSFVNLPGITDYFITNPTLTSSYFEVYHAPNEKGEISSPYLISGQGFLIDNFASGGGVSGTSIRDSNEKIYGLQFASDNAASAAFVLALRSYGYDYKGYYGKYNLPAYDIIYGSKNQFKSYFDAMLQLYGDKSDKKLKTNLFPNGFSESTRKDVFASKSDVINLPEDIQKRTYSRVVSKINEEN
ncbi:Ig-specific serine endopeptidase MIP [Mesomycoplasma ovipneumoniae]|uniref:Ig-specific serine endopeptidase MIP n=1 Tax=Mesomycoplasma ovipneumoniae TaxID=29562 RepID=UPI00311ADBFB